MSSPIINPEVKLQYKQKRYRKSVSYDNKKKFYINKKGNLRQFNIKKQKLGMKIR